MRILYINWVPTRLLDYRGGGVSLYQKNLMSFFCGRGDEITYLTAGTSYSLFRNKPYIKKIQSEKYPEIKEYEIVNSSYLAPSFFSFDETFGYFNENEDYRILEKFLNECGPFDVVHINNLEGFSGLILSFKKILTSTKFILSLHNYFPFCAQVNFWYKDKENCINYDDGKKCLTCNIFPINKGIVKAESALANFFGKYKYIQIIKPYLYKIHLLMRNKKGQIEPSVVDINHALRRDGYVALINEGIDVLHAVSERVKNIAIAYGIKQDLCKVSYIGTTHAENYKYAKPKIQHDGILHICYMGYLRPDKGFYFLLEALENMPEELANKISVTVAAPNTDAAAIHRLTKLSYKFNTVNYLDGYKQSEVKQILKTVHLGLVPVLWEDNLPQITLEFVSNGVPVLASNLGGARELSGAEEFCFDAGSFRSFYEKIRAIVSDKNLLSKYWRNFSDSRLNTVEQHCKQLLDEIY